MASMEFRPMIWKPLATRNGSLFMLVFGLFFVLVLWFEPKKEAGNWILWAIYLLWTLAALFGVIYSLRTHVESDENGVRWRDWRGVWRAAKWHEISDFWLTSEKGLTKTVETKAGKFDFGPEMDGKLLAQRFSERAENAKTRQWQIKGERICDEWPRRFEFWQSHHFWGPIVSLGLCFFVILAFAPFLIRVWPQLEKLPFSAWFLAYVGPILMVLAVPLTISVFSFIAARRAQLFRGQNIEISPEGLNWNGPTRWELVWSQIENWSWQKRGRSWFLRAQTPNGALEIPEFLRGFRALCRMIEKFGGVSIIKGGQEARFLENPPVLDAQNALIFRPHQFEVRVFRWMFGALLVVIPSTVFLMRLADSQADLDASILWIIPLYGALLLVLEWWTRTHFLRLTSEKLERRGPRWNCDIAWETIESFGAKTGGADWIEVGGEKISIERALASMAHRSRLRSEIETRAVNAKGNWETPVEK